MVDREDLWVSVWTVFGLGRKNGYGPTSTYSTLPAPEGKLLPKAFWPSLGSEARFRPNVVDLSPEVPPPILGDSGGNIKQRLNKINQNRNPGRGRRGELCFSTAGIHELY